jgi:hypothetical protein
VQVANLRPQQPETAGLDATDHLRAVLEHGTRVDTFLYEGGGPMAADDSAIRTWAVEPVGGEVARGDGLLHDPGKLAMALRALL